MCLGMAGYRQRAAVCDYPRCCLQTLRGKKNQAERETVMYPPQILNRNPSEAACLLREPLCFTLNSQVCSLGKLHANKLLSVHLSVCLLTGVWLVVQELRVK